MSAPLGFRPHLDRVDECLLRAVQQDNPNLSGLEPALRYDAKSLADVFPPAADGLPRHFGHLARSLWTFVDEVFKLGMAQTGDTPRGFHPKSAQVADIYEPPAVFMGDRTAYIALAVLEGDPVLVPCPILPPILLGKPEAGATLSDTRDALHELSWEIAARLTIIAPAARALGPAVTSD